jgi:rRNA maturation RNase YbeY
MPIAVSSRLRRRLRLSLLHALAGKILKAAGASRSDLSLLLVGDRAMRRLNRRYRRMDRTTDVLAFPMRHVRSRLTPSAAARFARSGGPAIASGDGGHAPFLGDVVISLPQAARQAKQAGHSIERELAVLVTHGVLHLLGYDHKRSAREARRMLRREQAVLRRVGY